MRVGIYESVEVSDEQRKSIAQTLGKKTATRDDLKEFVWKYGEQWPLMVNGATPASDAEGALDATVDGEPNPIHEDLLGGVSASTEADSGELSDLL